MLFEKVKLAKKLYLYSLATARCVFVRHSHSFIVTQNTLARGRPLDPISDENKSLNWLYSLFRTKNRSIWQW